MMVEMVIFNLLAFTLFIFVFLKMIVKNDTSYLVLLIVQMIGITINFMELTYAILQGTFFKVIMYITAICIPIVLLGIEWRGFNFSEILHVGMAKLFFFFGNATKAKEYLDKLTKKYEQSYLGHKFLAEILIKEGQKEKGLEEYIKVIDSNKKDYHSYFIISDLLKQLGRKEEAALMLDNLLEIRPDYTKASLLLGEIYFEQERYKEAINIYMEALRYNVIDYDIYYSLGMTYTMLNDFQNAKNCYEKAAQINTLLYSGYYNLGQIAMIYDDLEEAEKYFLKSIEGEEVDAGSYYYLAKISMLKGEREKAITYLNLSMELDPSTIKLAQEETLFIPIKKYIRIPKIELEDKTLKKVENKMEQITWKHLKETQEIVGKLSYRDIRQEKKKEIGLDEEKEREED